jgi:hypothetical protein
LNYTIAGNAAVNFFLLIFLLTGPKSSFPLADIRFFKRTTLFLEKRIHDLSFLKISFFVLIITPTILVLGLTRLFDLVIFTLVLTKFPIVEDFRLHP